MFSRHPNRHGSPASRVRPVGGPIGIAVLLSAGTLLAAGCASHRSIMCGGYSGQSIPRIEVSVAAFDHTLDIQPTLRIDAGAGAPYPFEMKRAGITGDVLATVTIDAKGAVTGVTVDRASQMEFGPAAIDCLNHAAFFPATRHQQPVATQVQCAVAFHLDEE